MTSTRKPFAPLTMNHRNAPNETHAIGTKIQVKSSVSVPRPKPSVLSRPAGAGATVGVAPKKSSFSSVGSSIAAAIAADRKKHAKQTAATKISIDSFAHTDSLSAALATKTMSDPAWSARQERGFVEWINYQLVGQATPNATQTEPIIPDALYARHRAGVLQLYHSSSLQSILTKLDGEIDAGHVTLKGISSHLCADYGLRTELLSLFLTSWCSFWQRIICETLAGFEVPRPRTKETLEQFVTEFMFESNENKILPKPPKDDGVDDDTAAASMDADHRAKWEHTRSESRARATLKKVLRMILLADRCKLQGFTGGMPSSKAAAPSTPTLFRSSSTLQSSKAMLEHLSARFLNEGDCVRHLSFLGYSVSFTEPVEDQVDFSVHTLATDLRDGVRLGKLVEMLVNARATEQKPATSSKFAMQAERVHMPIELISQMRLPADTDAKKLFNIGVTLTALTPYLSTSFLHTISPQDILLGSRTKTCALLWQLQVRFDVNRLVENGELEAEKKRIECRHARLASRLPTYLSKPQENLYFGPSESVQQLLTWIQTVLWGSSLESITRHTKNTRGDDSTTHAKMQQLRVENFTTSFRSGVVACIVIQYYFPWLIPAGDIKYPVQRPDKVVWQLTGRDLEEDTKEDDINTHESSSEQAANWVGSYSCASVFASSDADDIDLHHSKSNWSLVQSALDQLHGPGEGLTVSTIFSRRPTSDHTPDEKSMIAFATWMASRLLILAEEIHAVKRIQACARAYIARARVRRAAREALERKQQAERQARLKLEALAREAAQREDAIRSQRLQEERALKRAARVAEEEAREAALLEARAQRIAEANRLRLEQQQREFQEMMRREEEEREEEARREREEAEAIERQQAEERAIQIRLTELARVSTVFSSAWRGKMGRRCLAEARYERFLLYSHAATVIQSAVRGKIARVHAAETRRQRDECIAAQREEAAEKIQCAWRCTRARRQLQQLQFEREEQIYFARLQYAATQIQCAYRCSLARRTLAGLRFAECVRVDLLRRASAALLIQCAFRAFRARVELANRREAHEELQILRYYSALNIQCAWRQMQSRRRFAELKQAEEARQVRIAIECAAATQIQCAWRCASARRTLHALQAAEAERIAHERLCHESAIKIQSLLRMVRAQRELLHLRHAESERLASLQRAHDAAHFIQRVWVGHATRMWFAGYRASTLSACVTLQKYFRSRCARKELARRIDAKRTAEAHAQRVAAAVCLQAAVRARQARLELTQLKHAAELRRAAQVRLEHASATTVQCVWKCMVARRELRRLRSARAALMTASCVTIQCAYRCFVARGVLSDLKLEMAELKAEVEFEAARTIQTAIRAYQARQQLTRLRIERDELEFVAAVCIQSAVRQHQARCVLRSLRQQESARLSHLASMRHLAAFRIQSSFRCHRARRELADLIRARDVARATLQLHTSKATIIQAAFRRHQARMAIKALIESRRVRVAQRAALELKSAESIQCCWRSHCARRVLHALRSAKADLVRIELRRHHAATDIQCAFRAFIARRVRARRHQARMDELAAERARLAARRAAIDAMQAEVRALEARAAKLAEQRAKERAAAEAQLKLTSAVKLQSLYRGMVARRQVATLRVARAAAKEQAYAAALAKLTQVERQARDLRRRIATNKIAAAWLAYAASTTFQAKKMAKQNAAAIVIQRMARGMLSRSFARCWSASILTMQRIFRARQVRRMLGAQQKRMDAIAKKLRAARGNVSEERRIGNRTKTALEILLSSTNLSTVLQATQTLDRTTGLLGVCCRDAIKQNAVPALLDVTRSLNRSKPHLLLLESTLNILSNLALEKSTAPFVFRAPHLLDIIVDGMQSYAASPSLLLKLCRFITIGVVTDAALRSTLQHSASLMKRVTGVQSLLERKLFLETKSAAASTSIKRATPAAPASAATSSVAGKKVLKKVGLSSPPAAAFDQFSCACHGLVGSSVTGTPAEKVHALTACCQHIAEFISAINATK